MAPQILECTFKQAEGLDIKADVLLPPGATKESPAPVLLWWHGGGLLQGTRKGGYHVSPLACCFWSWTDGKPRHCPAPRRSARETRPLRRVGRLPAGAPGAAAQDPVRRGRRRGLAPDGRLSRGHAGPRRCLARLCQRQLCRRLARPPCRLWARLCSVRPATAPAAATGRHWPLPHLGPRRQLLDDQAAPRHVHEGPHHRWSQRTGCLPRRKRTRRRLVGPRLAPVPLLPLHDPGVGACAGAGTLTNAC